MVDAVPSDRPPSPAARPRPALCARPGSRPSARGRRCQGRGRESPPTAPRPARQDPAEQAAACSPRPAGPLRGSPVPAKPLPDLRPNQQPARHRGRQPRPSTRREAHPNGCRASPPPGPQLPLSLLSPETPEGSRVGRGRAAQQPSQLPPPLPAEALGPGSVRHPHPED